jgi:dipeptidase E
MRLLLISNSTTAGQSYLQWPIEHIRKFLGGCAETVAFVPYAAVTFSYDEYEARVQKRFDDLGIEVRSVHREADPARAIREAEAIVVGGGNTFALLKKMREQGLVDAVRMAAGELGVPYVGWSAGSNVACPSIRTTNDMPIVEPDSFAAAGLVPFQINPHYLDAHPDGHAGETREQRIEEFIAANPGVKVAGLREGCLLRIEGDRRTLVGERPMRIFRSGAAPREINPGESLDSLWE